LARRALAALWLVLLLSTSVFGGQPARTTVLGARVGLFDNSHNEVDPSLSDVQLFANRTVFYIEAYLNYYLTDYLALAVNAGSYSKGDIRFSLYVPGGTQSFIGQAAVYPIQAGMKLSPFSNQLPLRSHLYVEGGGALIVGRETADFGSYAAYFGDYSGSVHSETDFNWWAAIGNEIPLSETLQLDLMVKYLNTTFSGNIAGIKDYSGVQFTVGIGYSKQHKKK
jgi:hypothetical protein